MAWGARGTLHRNRGWNQYQIFKTPGENIVLDSFGIIHDQIYS